MSSLGVLWQAIKLLIQYLPALIEAIQKGENFIVVTIKTEEFKNAEGKAQDTKDTSQLEGIFNPVATPSQPASTPNK